MNDEVEPPAPCEDGSLDVDAAFEGAGAFGRAQACVIGIMGFAWILVAAGFSLPVFITAEPEREVTKCSVSAAAGAQDCMQGQVVTGDAFCGDGSEWTYADAAATVSAEWNLVCNRRLMASSVGSVYFFGVLLGNLLFTPVPDRIGRCKAFTLSSWSALLAACYCAIARSFASYLLGRFFLGLNFAGIGLVAYVSASEIVDASHTSMVMLIMNLIWALGVMIVALFAFLMPNWRTLSLIHAFGIFLLCIISTITWFKKLDSPRWLASRGNMKAFQRVMGLLAHVNGRTSQFEKAMKMTKEHKDCTPEQGLTLESVSQNCSRKQDDVASSACLSDARTVLCMRPLSIYSALFAMAFCVCSLGYFGLSLNIGNLGGDLYLTTLLNSLVEVPAVLAAQRLVELPWAGRRGTVACSVGVSGAFCLFSAILPEGSSIATGVAILGKGFVTTAYCGIFVHVGEVFPASVRGFAYGIFQTCSRVTGVIAPIAVELPSPLPLVVIGISCVAVSMPLFSLPETRGKPIPATIAEACARAQDERMPVDSAKCAP